MASNDPGTRAGTDVAQAELVITRVFDAPRELVFKAWTDPKHFVRWWGPKDFTTPYCTIDLRPGGAIHFCLRSPKGEDVWGKGIYREIVAPERIVVTDFFSDAEGHLVEPSRYGIDPGWPMETLITVTFTEQAGKTTMTLRWAIGAAPASEREGAQMGWTESFDRLADYLATLQRPDR